MGDFRILAEWDWVVCAADGHHHLHALEDLQDEAASETDGGGQGRTACDRFGYVCIPGIIERMALMRCPACCEARDIRPGAGSPKNAGPEIRARVQQRLDHLGISCDS